jgi:hypothetical protein
MAKSPKVPGEIFQEFTDDYKAALGEDLVSIVLYGSGAGADYLPGKSDLNFMIVLSEQGIEALDRAFGAVKKWRKRGVAVPLFLTEEYLETSLDVYPIEYLEFRDRYVPVYGKDVLKDLDFDKESLRLQCEREIKGKLLLLRHAFLESEGKGHVLKEVVVRSLTAFMAIFNALLYLKGETVPVEKRERVRTICEDFELDYAVFEKLLDVKEKKMKLTASDMKELVKAYLKAVGSLARRVDRMELKTS